jgi:hypothetical protein
MKIAALTFVYNESVNLPIWRRYYGEQFGDRNLFIIDRESNDGSTDDLGDANRIRVPRDAFDDRKKVECISSLQNALIPYYDAVVCGDCDEIVVPNPTRHKNLSDYINNLEFDYATCVGIDVIHIINQEPPIDLKQPILSQRHYGRFQSAGCKTLVSRAPLRWAPGNHGCNRQPRVDPDLVNFHLRLMDYNIATLRQKINQDTAWSADSVMRNFGAHHRYDLAQFVRESFFDPVNVVQQNKLEPFEFSQQIEQFHSRVVELDGFFLPPMNIGCFVEIPEAFRGAL